MCSVHDAPNFCKHVVTAGQNELLICIYARHLVGVASENLTIDMANHTNSVSRNQQYLFLHQVSFAKVKEDRYLASFQTKKYVGVLDFHADRQRGHCHRAITSLNISILYHRCLS